MEYTLEPIWDEFHENNDLLTEVFDDVDEYALQFWSPYVPRGHLTDGVAELPQRFEAEQNVRIDLVNSGEYTTEWVSFNSEPRR